MSNVNDLKEIHHIEVTEICNNNLTETAFSNNSQRVSEVCADHYKSTFGFSLSLSNR